MTTIVIARRPTVEEVTNLKAVLKDSGIPASVRIQKNIKRSYGSISVIPGHQTRKENGNGFRMWSIEQTAKVIEIMRGLGFYVPEYEHETYCYQQSICYIMKLV